MRTIQEYLTRNAPVEVDGSPKKREPVCDVCGGLRHLRRDVPIENPHFGEIFPCPKCSKALFENRLEAETGLVEAERQLNWNKVADINNAVQAVEAVKATLERGYGWVFLWGAWGLAKTLILQIAVAESLKSSKDARYIRMVEIIDNLKIAFDKRDSGSDENRRIETWSSLPVLSIDEFEKINETDWASNRRFLLLDKRYQEAIREKSVTIFASNCDPASFEGYLASRIFDNRFKVVHLTGADVRKKMVYPKP